MDTVSKKYQRASERVREVKNFYQSILSFVLVGGALAGLNYWLNEFSNPWILWVAGFWALGLLLKGLKLFATFPFMGKNWEERKIKEYMDRDRSGLD